MTTNKTEVIDECKDNTIVLNPTYEIFWGHDKTIQNYL